LLGFDVSGGRLAGYAPPIDNPNVRRRFGFMEPAGDRWWAVGGAVYMLQAIKRVRGMRLLTPAWQEQKDAREKALAAAKRQSVSHLKVVK
ncbi:MAG TPA: SAM-dependent methyltransferase, partial [Usitatibacter sp.]|nr:SAM-dependent methyltransferase [Usitatibacter sp.]